MRIKIRLVLDNALTSSTISDFCSKYGIELSTSLAWTPQSNGGCEVVHKTMRATLPIIMSEMKCSPRRWSDVLLPATEAYNNTVHSVTGFTPNELMLGILSTEIYSLKNDNQLKQKWLQASENNRKAIESRIRAPAFRTSKQHYWPVGTRVVVHPARRGKKFLATVAKDMGNSCRILKDGRNRRFSMINYKKSRLTKIPEGVNEKDLLL